MSYKSIWGMEFEEKIEGDSFLLAENNFGVKTGVESDKVGGVRSQVNKMP